MYLHAAFTSSGGFANCVGESPGHFKDRFVGLGRAWSPGDSNVWPGRSIFEYPAADAF